MSLHFLIALAVGMLGISVVTLVAGLWLGARVWQVPDVSWGKAGRAACGVILANLVFLAAMLFLVFRVADANAGAAGIGACALLALYAATAVWIVRRALGVGLVKAVCVGLTAFGLQGAIGMALAVGFRQRFAEAFVIPTGSMAPTLYGAHFDVTCPNCGHAFGAGAAHRTDANFERAEESADCPNCRTMIPIAADLSPRGGDRVLVDKHPPRRWDCAAYRTVDGSGNVYLHRVVALPGESCELAGGDVFIDDRRLVKHPHRQTDLWFFCHDTRCVPKERDEDTPGWHSVAAHGAWSESTGGGWKCAAPASESAELEFLGPITDESSYFTSVDGSNPPRPGFSGDVRVTCDLTRLAGPGSLTLVWEFQGRELQLAVRTRGAEIATAEQQLAANTSEVFFQPGRPLEFAVRDGVAYVLGGGSEISATILPESFAAASQPSPSPEGPCRLRLVARDCQVELAGLRIDRDIYYLNAAQFAKRLGLVSEANLGAVKLPARLGAGQHLLLGDNVASSRDSRFTGPVPPENLIGAARWRYWPVARWHELD